MSTIEQRVVQKGFVDIKKIILSFIKQNNVSFSKEDFAVYYYFLKVLDDIITKLSLDELPSDTKPYAILSSMVVELPTYMLDPKLGGEIIDLEKNYLKLYSRGVDR